MRTWMYKNSGFLGSWPSASALSIQFWDGESLNLTSLQQKFTPETFQLFAWPKKTPFQPVSDRNFHPIWRGQTVPQTPNRTDSTTPSPTETGNPDGTRQQHRGADDRSPLLLLPLPARVALGGWNQPWNQPAVFFFWGGHVSVWGFKVEGDPKLWSGNVQEDVVLTFESTGLLETR